PICLRLFWHWLRAAASRTFCTAGNKRPMRTAMMAMTTRSSISVKPRRRKRVSMDHPPNRYDLEEEGPARGPEGDGPGKLHPTPAGAEGQPKTVRHEDTETSTGPTSQAQPPGGAASGGGRRAAGGPDVAPRGAVAAGRGVGERGGGGRPGPVLGLRPGPPGRVVRGLPR